MSSDRSQETPAFFRADGHASDWAIGALADEQDELIPFDVSSHVDSCLLCTDRLVEMSLLSLSLGELYREVEIHETSVAPLETLGGPPSRAPSPFPILPFCLAWGLVGLGVVPGLWGGEGLMTRLELLIREVIGVARGLRLVLSLEQSEVVLIVLSLITSLLAWVGGAFVARRARWIQEPVG